MPLDPTHRDWHAVAGNNPAYLFRVPVGDGWADLSGARMQLRIVWRGGEITMVSGQTQLIDGLRHGLWIGENQAEPLEKGKFWVRLTLAQSRMLPTGLRPARYEIEQRRDGEQRTVFWGAVVVRVGINTDDALPPPIGAYLTTEDGLILTTEDGKILTTELEL